MIFSPEEFIIDLEIIRKCKRMGRGIETGPDKWLDDVISHVGPGGDFLAQQSTRTALRSGELHISTLGCHEPYERWEAAGKPDILKEAREEFDRIARDYRPLAWDDTIDKELTKLQKTALGE